MYYFNSTTIHAVMDMAPFVYLQMREVRVLLMTALYAIGVEFISQRSVDHNDQSWDAVSLRRDIERRSDARAFAACSIKWAMVAYFFVLTAANMSWFDPFYRNDGVASPVMSAYVAVYLEVQIACFLCEFVYASSGGFLSGLVCGIRWQHIILPAVLIQLESLAGNPPAVCYIALMVQLDFMHAWAATHKLMLAGKVSPLSVSIPWIAICIGIPLHGIYRKRFGYVSGPGMAFGVVLAQVVLWFWIQPDQTLTRRNEDRRRSTVLRYDPGSDSNDSSSE